MELGAHVAIVLDEGQHDLIDGANSLLLRQSLVGAVKPLGIDLAVGQVRLEHPYDVVQNPIDLLPLDGRLPPRRLLTVALIARSTWPQC